MLFAEVVQVLNALDEVGVRHWVSGGWGVVTLVGRQSREHRDDDVAIDADDLQGCLRTLNDLGYHTEVDWLPVRIELRAPIDGLTCTGAFRRQRCRSPGRPERSHFDCPPEALTAGTLNGRLIGCLSIQEQLDFHTGYEHQAKDKHDAAELNALDHR